MSNWAYNLDLLAQNGVLDFDAASYVTGQNPRYIGSPCSPVSPYAGPPYPAAPVLNQPQVDEFKSSNDNNFVKNPSWKKWAFGALALGAVVFGACKFKSVTRWIKKIPDYISNKFKSPKIKTFCTDKAKSVKTFFKEGWKKFTGLFK